MKKIAFGIMAMLFLLQVLTVFAQDRQTLNLNSAIREGNISDVRNAIRRGANVNYNGYPQTFLVSAVIAGNIEMVRLLLDNNANPNLTGTSGNFALHEAIVKGNLEITRLLLDRGADVARRSRIGSSALRTAIESENLEMVRLLVDRGANINDRDRYGAVFLQAAGRQNIEILKYFLERGANINATDNNFIEGSTALHLSISNIEIVRYLIEKGININSRDDLGKTALHYAVSQERLDIVRYLVENGSNVNARDSKGKSALNLAYEKGEMTIHAYLLANGAIEFEVTQTPESVNTTPSQSTTVIVQQPTPVPAQTTQTQQPAQNNPVQPRLTTGFYWENSVRGSQIQLSLGVAFHSINNANQSQGNYSMDGGQLIINWYSGPLSGTRSVYRIDSANQFSNAHEVWKK